VLRLRLMLRVSPRQGFPGRRILESHPFITCYRSFISPRVPIGTTTVVFAFTSLMAARLRDKKTALDDYEGEVGRHA
jgi:hypothetical protein